MGKSQSRLDTPVLVSIDFGTTFTGYAFTFTSEPATVYTNLGDVREPTCILLDSEQNFVSFGKQAVEMYNDISPEVKTDYYFFNNFKMALYEPIIGRLKRNSKISDFSGKHMEAIEVFVLALKYLKQKIMKHLNQTKVSNFDSNTLEEKIGWIITIPAIWTDPARQFMREAARKAGIQDEQLRLILEPEAAALYATKKQSKLNHKSEACRFSVGDKYILADLGGGTVDICVHEVMANGKLRELFRATGGHTGGSKVDEEFKEFLITLFGSKVLKEYQEKHTEEFFDLFRKFDVKKKSFSTDTREVTIPFDYDLVTLIKKVTGKQVHDAIALYLGSVKFKEHGRKLVLSQHTMAGFFEPSINVVIGKVRNILDVCKEDLISTLMLAGGFSESPYLREKLVSAFPKLQIIVPDEPSLAVVKGALLMGLEPKNVIQRRAQYSYGFDVSETFDPDIHPDSLKAERDGETYCKHIFDKQITKGQILTHQQVFVRKTTDVLKMTESKQMKLSAAVFRSHLETPRYCTEDGCELVGVVTMTPPPEGWPDVLNVEHQLIVGETELKIRVVDRTTGSEYESTMDFL